MPEPAPAMTHSEKVKAGRAAAKARRDAEEKLRDSLSKMAAPEPEEPDVRDVDAPDAPEAFADQEMVEKLAFVDRVLAFFGAQSAVKQGGKVEHLYEGVLFALRAREQIRYYLLCGGGVLPEWKDLGLSPMGVPLQKKAPAPVPDSGPEPIEAWAGDGAAELAAIDRELALNKRKEEILAQRRAATPPPVTPGRPPPNNVRDALKQAFNMSGLRPPVPATPMTNDEMAADGA